MRFRLLLLFSLILQLLPVYSSEISQSDGKLNLDEGKRLHHLARFEEAAPYFWRAVLAHSSTKDSNKYTLKEAFGLFLNCYSARGKTLDAYLHVAKESFSRGQFEMTYLYLNQILVQEPSHNEALLLKQMLDSKVKSDDTRKDEIHHYYTLGTQYFARKEYTLAANTLQRACDISNGTVDLPVLMQSIAVHKY